MFITLDISIHSKLLCSLQLIAILCGNANCKTCVSEMSKAGPHKHLSENIDSKEVIFHVSAPNYLDFLTTMLAKHDKSLYKVTEKKRYTFKYLPGTSHAYVGQSLMAIHLSQL